MFCAHPLICAFSSARAVLGARSDHMTYARSKGEKPVVTPSCVDKCNCAETEVTTRSLARGMHACTAHGCRASANVRCGFVALRPHLAPPAQRPPFVMSIIARGHDSTDTLKMFNLLLQI